MLKLMWIEEHPVWIPVTEQEDAESAMFAEAVRSIPEEQHMKPIYQPYAEFYGPGMHAKKEYSPETQGYDYLYAELCRDRDAEKARVRNRRKGDRKHKLTPKMRKEQEYMRNRNICMKMVDFGTWDDIPIVEGRVRSADKIARADYQTELRNIAEDDERMKVEAEVREWERKQAVEQANRRAWMMMQDWLEWA